MKAATVLDATSHNTSTTPAPVSLSKFDRCDVANCGAQAFLFATNQDNHSLFFCGHHGRKFTPGLVSTGFSVTDHTALINKEPSVSANQG